MPIDCQEEESRDDHAAESGGERQRAARPSVELARTKLALDLQSDQEKKQRHQSIVDPMEQVEIGDFRVEKSAVGSGKRGVGGNQPERGTRHQRESAGGFSLGKPLE